MFLDLAYTKKPVFEESKRFVLECDRITKDFPQEERFTMVQQIRRAALSVHLNIAEGCSGRSETNESGSLKFQKVLLSKLIPHWILHMNCNTKRKKT